MTAATVDAPATGLASTEPAVSWALVQAFVQAVMLLGDVTVLGSIRPEVLGAIHGVAASGIAIAGAVYTRNRTLTHATLDVLRTIVPAPTDEVAEATAQRVLQLMPQPFAAELGEIEPALTEQVHVAADVGRVALAGLYEVVTAQAPPGSWSRARIAEELRQLDVAVYRRSA